MRKAETSDLWWKNAIVYCLDVETFFDGNDDGVGDFSGLTDRLDYLAELGVTCLWLMPFYPTPERDDGYDVTDFYGVDPRLGTMGDVVEFIRTAKDRGMRVIVDLVLNHTSDKHPWFKAARSSKDNPFRDFYVWRDTPPPDTSDQVVFPDQENSLWELDERTGECYLHNFYKHQPDLNIANPKVRDEVARIIGFWLQLGLDGFRVDAVPFFVETKGIDTAQLNDYHDPHDYLRALRALLNRRSGEAALLGEVNVPYADQKKFFGGDRGDELNMMFDFMGMQALYLSLARNDARPLAKALAGRPKLAPESQYANFVRNHDELTLDKLSDDERQQVFDAFGPDPDMQLFGRGLKRRLPPMLEGDPRRLEMVYSLMFALPGTPVLFYGEEIGMGEDLSAEGRMAVRTPMQWTSGKNAGFSTVAPSRVTRAVVQGAYGPEHVNVARSRHDQASLLNFITRLASRYRECPEVGFGDVTILKHDVRSVLAHRCTWHTIDGSNPSTVLIHNFSSEPATVDLELAEIEGATDLSDLFSDTVVTCDDRGRVSVPVDGYGHLWLRVHGPQDRRIR
ncbi:alpha-amylase family protein [Mariniluteicoccus flavus]